MKSIDLHSETNCIKSNRFGNCRVMEQPKETVTVSLPKIAGSKTMIAILTECWYYASSPFKLILSNTNCSIRAPISPEHLVK
jgi:hypothetical protein